MIQKLKNKLVILASAVLLAVPALAPATASAYTSNQLQGAVCSGTKLDVSSKGQTGLAGCNQQGDNSLNKLLVDAVNIFSAIVGVVAVIMIIYGGLRYITSGGDSTKVSAAKNTLIYAIIGLIIVALAQLIVHFVLQKASSIG